MQNDDYKKISTGMGQQIRNLMNSALVEAAYVPGRAALDEALLEMFPDEASAPIRGALATKFKQYARAAQDRSARFELRGRIDKLALHVVDELEAADRLIAVPDEEPVDVDSLMKTMDSYSDRIGGELDRKHDQKQAAAQKLLRDAGLS